MSIATHCKNSTFNVINFFDHFLPADATEASEIIIGFDDHGIKTYSRHKFDVRSVKSSGSIQGVAYDIKNK